MNPCTKFFALAWIPAGFLYGFENDGDAFAVEVIRRVKIDAYFLHLPLVQPPGARKASGERMTIEDDQGKVLRYMHLNFPPPGKEAGFTYSVDLREFRGREVTMRLKSADLGVLERLKFGDKEVVDPRAYDGPHRPRFHFSPRLGWMNDINGTYWQDGLYHLFYQFNPTTTAPSAGFDMHWGHSVSRDLVHWEEWPVALFPDGAGQCYSGTSILVDRRIPGLHPGPPAKPISALMFTATEPFSQHLSLAEEGGRSWKRYLGNPVVGPSTPGNRDPKVFWHEPSQHYVMLLWEAKTESASSGFSVRRSKELIHWERVGHIPGWYECPEFIPMKSAVTGEHLWLLYGFHGTPHGKASEKTESAYQLGRFDGKNFMPVDKVRRAHQGPNFYAALTFLNEPKERHVMMGWARGTQWPEEPFNQCATLPLELVLKAVDSTDRLFMKPVEELEILRGDAVFKLRNISVGDANKRLANLSKEGLYDIVLRVKSATEMTFGAAVQNEEFSYTAGNRVLQRKSGGKDTRAVELRVGKSMDVRFLIDRGIVECFWNDGEAAYAFGSLHTTPGTVLDLRGNALVEELTVYPMARIWK